MEGESILPSPAVISPTLDIGRAYNASEAAAILGITPYVLNERVREGWIKPVFETGDRRCSGYILAQLLGWPLRGRVTNPLSRRERVRVRVRASPAFSRITNAQQPALYGTRQMAPGRIVTHPLSDNPRDDFPAAASVRTGAVSRPLRRVRAAR